MVRYVFLLLLAYSLIPWSVRRSCPVADVPKIREVKAYLRGSCCKRRPSFWISVFWTCVLTSFVTLECLVDEIHESVKNGLASLTFWIFTVGCSMRHLWKPGARGYSEVIFSLWCGVNTVLQDLTPAECISQRESNV